MKKGFVGKHFIRTTEIKIKIAKGQKISLKRNVIKFQTVSAFWVGTFSMIFMHEMLIRNLSWFIERSCLESILFVGLWCRMCDDKEDLCCFTQLLPRIREVLLFISWYQTLLQLLPYLQQNIHH